VARVSWYPHIGRSPIRMTCELKLDADGLLIVCCWGAFVAAVGFAGLLVTIMRSDEVRGILSDLVRSALSVG
jgi:hypothetical protein